jgi:minor histocompatibility antigen H13
MKQARVDAPKPYYIGALVGYMVAIVATVIVMIVFDHG